MKRPPICIDFDGCINDHLHPVEGRKMGAPLPGAVDAIQDIHDFYHVIIHTTMANSPSGRKAVADWLEFYGVDYDEISPKPAAQFYVDVRGIKFKDWQQVKKAVGID